MIAVTIVLVREQDCVVNLELADDHTQEEIIAAVNAAEKKWKGAPRIQRIEKRNLETGEFVFAGWTF